MKTFNKNPIPKDFKGKVHRITIVVSLISAYLIFIYASLLVDLPKDGCYKELFGILTLIIAVTQLFCTPFTNSKLTTDVTHKLNYLKSTGLSIQDRTELVQRLAKLPYKITIGFSAYYYLCSAFMTAYIKIRFGISYFNCFIFCFACLTSSSVTAIIVYHISSTLCSSICKEIASQGLEEKVITEKKFFCTRDSTLFILYIVIPLVFTGLLTFIVLALNPNKNNFLKIFQTIYLAATNIIFVIITTTLFYKRLFNYTSEMQNNLVRFSSKSFKKENLFYSDFFTEMSYTNYMINKAISAYSKIIINTGIQGAQIAEESTNLSTIASETNSTSITQSSSINEILTTMENAEKLSKDIENKITEVSKVADNTVKAADEGVDSVKENIDKMQKIIDSNTSTIDGIQSLYTKIKGIQDIVNLIDNVADQTKIIAFNAELEAGNITDKDNRFHNVSGEIRKLADNTMELTKEIKKQIDEIKESSNELTKTGTDCSKKIQEGNKVLTDLNNKLNAIKNSSNLASESYIQIKQNIIEQTQEFNDLVETLTQISSSVQNYNDATAKISDSINELQKDTFNLQKLNLE